MGFGWITPPEESAFRIPAGQLQQPQGRCHGGGSRGPHPLQEEREPGFPAPLLANAIQQLVVEAAVVRRE